MKGRPSLTSLIAKDIHMQGHRSKAKTRILTARAARNKPKIFLYRKYAIRV